MFKSPINTSSLPKAFGMIENVLEIPSWASLNGNFATEAREAAANKIAEGVMNYEEGRIRGDHTNNADGSLDQVYNAEYAQNEKISNDGVKTKSAEDLAWDKIKKAVLDKDKK